MGQNKKVIMVTGGSSGIGAAIVKLASQLGYTVAFCYKQNLKAAEKLCSESVQAFQGDIADPHFACAFFDHAQGLGEVVALVNNAGITGRLGPFVETDYETMKQVYEVNVLGTMLMTQEVLKRWSKTKTKGAIVNLSSIAATLGAADEYVHYAASKAAIEAFTCGIGKEFAQHGIRINCVSPGTIETEIHAKAGDSKRTDKVVGRIPMKRIGRPEEIAKAVLWLLSDEASYATGATLKVTGGL